MMSGIFCTFVGRFALTAVELYIFIYYEIYSIKHSTLGKVVGIVESHQQQEQSAHIGRCPDWRVKFWQHHAAPNYA